MNNLRERAMTLERRLQEHFKENKDAFLPSCTLFFSSDVSEAQIKNKMRIIKEVALILQDGYDPNNLHDDKLLTYYQLLQLNTSRNSSAPRERLKLSQFQALKSNALIGCYLVNWHLCSKYNRSRNRDAVISLFSDDLEVEFYLEWPEKEVQSYLEAFSIFCSFIYENRVTYAKLNGLLGDTIQVDISMAMPSSESLTSMVYAVVSDAVELGSSVINLSS